MFMTSQLNRWNSNQVTIYRFLIYECFWVNNLSISIFFDIFKNQGKIWPKITYFLSLKFFSECKSHTLLSITYVLYHNISLLSLNGQFNQNQYREYQIFSLSVFFRISSHYPAVYYYSYHFRFIIAPIKHC